MKIILKNDKKEIEELKAEDISKETLDKIFDPAPYAINVTIEDFKKNPSNELIDSIHLCLLDEKTLKSPKTPELLIQLMDFLKEYPDFYNNLILIFCDLSHLNLEFSEFLFENGIFDYIDFSKDLSFSLIFNTCQSSEMVKEAFMKKYYKPEYDSNRFIKKLLN